MYLKGGRAINEHSTFRKINHVCQTEAILFFSFRTGANKKSTTPVAPKIKKTKKKSSSSSTPPGQRKRNSLRKSPQKRVHGEGSGESGGEELDTDDPNKGDISADSDDLGADSVWEPVTEKRDPPLLVVRCYGPILIEYLLLNKKCWLQVSSQYPPKKRKKRTSLPEAPPPAPPTQEELLAAKADTPPTETTEREQPPAETDTQRRIKLRHMDDPYKKDMFRYSALKIFLPLLVWSTFSLYSQL
jgi:hypothetical protein